MNDLLNVTSLYTKWKKQLSNGIHVVIKRTFVCDSYLEGTRSILLEKLRENDQFKDIGSETYQNPLGFSIMMDVSD